MTRLDPGVVLVDAQGRAIRICSHCAKRAKDLGYAEDVVWEPDSSRPSTGVMFSLFDMDLIRKEIDFNHD